MGSQAAKVLAAVVVAVAALGGTEALSVCNVTEEGFEACKPSVTQPDPVAPSPGCCDAVSGADLKCLCSYKHSAMMASLGIDPDLALALPPKCNRPLPTNC